MTDAFMKSIEEAAEAGNRMHAAREEAAQDQPMGAVDFGATSVVYCMSRIPRSVEGLGTMEFFLGTGGKPAAVGIIADVNGLYKEVIEAFVGSGFGPFKLVNHTVDEATAALIKYAQGAHGDVTYTAADAKFITASNLKRMIEAYTDATTKLGSGAPRHEKRSRGTPWGDRESPDIIRAKTTADDKDIEEGVEAALGAGARPLAPLPRGRAGNQRPTPNPRAFEDGFALDARGQGAAYDDLSPPGGVNDVALSPPAPEALSDIVVAHNLDHNCKGDAHEFRKLKTALLKSKLVPTALIDAMVNYSRPGGSDRTVFIKFSSPGAAAEFLKVAAGVCTDQNKYTKMVIKAGCKLIEFRTFRKNA